MVPKNVRNGNFTDINLFEVKNMTSHGVRSHGQLTSQVDGATLVESHGLNLKHLGPDTSINNT